MSAPDLATHLRATRDSGRKLLIPYVTGGLGSDWVATLEAVASAGADAVEIGLPFSDPMIDGPIIQKASVEALRQGATTQGIVQDVAKADLPVPVAVMTYYNIVARTGHHRMAHMLAEAGITGAILPDLPVDEIGDWADNADHAGVATVLLAAPTTTDLRLRQICARARGFLYAVGLMGVTGERHELAASAATIAERCKAATDLPVIVGIGISTPQQAAEVSRVADGVAVGSALVHRILDGGGPEGAAQLVREFRQALDG
ncbi:MAG TPA: tryptophan synthase subunit alpha [Acidimicrobiales bacterium]|nr:tryptophan synthase subunit alpha [Acidimicrobiales bacterium]